MPFSDPILSEAAGQRRSFSDPILAEAATRQNRNEFMRKGLPGVVRQIARGMDEDPDRGVIDELGAGVLGGTAALPIAQYGLARGGAAALRRVAGDNMVSSLIDTAASVGESAAGVMQERNRPSDQGGLGPRQVAYGVGAGAPQLVGQVGVGVATAGLGLPVQIAAFAGTAGGQSAGAKYLEALEAHRQRGLADSEAEGNAMVEASIAGLTTMATEAPVGALFLSRIPGFDRALSLIVPRFAVGLVQGGAAESVQEVTERIITDAASAAMRELPQPLANDPDYWRSLSVDAIAAGVLGGVAKGGLDLTSTTAAPGVTTPTSRPTPEAPAAPAPEEVVSPTPEEPVADLTTAEVADFEQRTRTTTETEKARQYAVEVMQSGVFDPASQATQLRNDLAAKFGLSSTKAKAVYDRAFQVAAPGPLSAPLPTSDRSLPSRDDPYALTPGSVEALAAAAIEGAALPSLDPALEMRRRMAEQGDAAIAPVAPLMERQRPLGPRQQEYTAPPTQRTLDIPNPESAARRFTENQPITLDEARTIGLSQTEWVEWQRAVNGPTSYGFPTTQTPTTVSAPSIPPGPASAGAVNIAAAPPSGPAVTVPVSLAQTGDTGKPVASPEVITAFQNIATALGRTVPIHTGRMSNKKNAGEFHVRPEVVRLKVANDIGVAAHEIAHAVEKTIYASVKGGTTLDKVMPKAAHDELIVMGQRLYGPKQPPNGYDSEGFAELVRLALTTDDASTTAPEAARWLDSWLSSKPAVGKAFHAARDATNRWRDQGSANRARGNIVPHRGPAARFGKFLRDLQPNFDRLWIEQASDLRKFSTALNGMVGPLSPSSDPYQTYAAYRGTAPATTRFMATKGTIDIAGNLTGESLADAINGVGRKNSGDFMVYLWARRAVALLRDPAGPRNPGMTLDDAEQILHELATPEFERAALRLYGWQDRVLDFAAQHSPRMAEVVQSIRARDPGSYIPLQREFSELDQMWGEMQSGSPGAKSSAFRGQLQGSGRRIKAPIQTILSNTQSLVSAARNERVLEAIFKHRDVDGIGTWLHEVPRHQVPVATVAAGEMAAQLKRLGGAPLPPGVDPDQAITLFRAAVDPTGPDPIVSREINGELRWFWLNPTVMRALHGVDPYRLPGVLDATLGSMARTFRLFTTGIRPAFTLVTNPLRDASGAWMKSQTDQNPLSFFINMQRALGESLLGAAGGRESLMLQRFHALGLQMAQPLGPDTDQTATATRELLQTRFRRVIDPRNALDLTRELLQFSERAFRLQEMRAMADKVGWDGKGPLTEDQAIALMNAAKQVTTDFTAGGSLGRVVNQVVPFFNASVQGPRAEVRSLLRNPRRYIARGMNLTALSVGLWLLNKDEEWWKELPDREKFTFWHIPVGRDLIRIPKPFEIGTVFSSLPEALLDAAYLDEPGATEAYARHFVTMLTPPILPPIVESELEIARNRDSFTGIPIVPLREARRPAAEQYGEYTSRAARWLGSTFDISPRQIDHRIRSYTGGLGMDIIRGLTGDEARTGEREAEPADLPVVGTLFLRGGQLGTSPKSIQNLYDSLEKARQRQSSIATPETKDQRSARLVLEDAADAVTLLGRMRRERVLRSEREAIQAEAIQIAREALQKVGEPVGPRDVAHWNSTRKKIERRSAAELAPVP